MCVHWWRGLVGRLKCTIGRRFAYVLGISVVTGAHLWQYHTIVVTNHVFLIMSKVPKLVGEC